MVSLRLGSSAASKLVDELLHRRDRDPRRPSDVHDLQFPRADPRRTRLEGADRRHHATRQDEAGEHGERQPAAEQEAGAEQRGVERCERLAQRLLDESAQILARARDQSTDAE